VRVVIADDNLLVRSGIAALLQGAGIEVAGQSASADELLREVDAHQPDVAIVDIRMPPTHSDEGLRAAQQIRASYPEMGIVILSQHVDSGTATRALAESPERLGYLLKDRVGDVEDFVATLRRVANGGSALDPTVVSRLLAARTDNGPLEPLTPREREVLQLVAEGLSNRAVSERLGITLGSAEKYVSGIFTKLGLPDTGGEYRRVLAVLRFLQA
jgi:DNA-binding NarL/FixJ family response regulator